LESGQIISQTYIQEDQRHFKNHIFMRRKILFSLNSYILLLKTIVQYTMHKRLGHNITYVVQEKMQIHQENNERTNNKK